MSKYNYRVHYINLGTTDNNCRVTFEAENNLDFRLGTGFLRNKRVAKKDDLACISRVGEDEYELRIIPKVSNNYNNLLSYAISFIGHQGKQYGFIENEQFEDITKARLGELG